MIRARLSASTYVPPPVATTAWPKRQQPAQHVAFDGAEVRLAAPREEVGHRAALARLDQLVDVLDAPVEAPTERRASVVLPAPMNPTR